MGEDPSDYTIHDPSRILTSGGKQMIAVTGKAQEDGYNCGIETWWRSTSSENWIPGQCLFVTKPSWVREETPLNDGAFWAPEIDFNRLTGVLTMVYSVTDMTDEGPTTCVGVATADGSFPDQLTWRDAGAPLSCIVGADYTTERSAIDPSVFWGMGGEEGRLFLVTGGGYIIGTELDPFSYDQINGNWFDVDDPDWTELARGPFVDGEYEWIEAAYVHPNQNDGYYYLFANWGACCRGLESTYEIRVGRSRNPMGPFVDQRGTDMTNTGGSLLLKSGTGDEAFVVGPGHPAIWADASGQEFLSFHYYDGRREGNSWIAEKPLDWSGGWPSVGAVTRAFPIDGSGAFDDDEERGFMASMMSAMMNWIRDRFERFT